MTPMRRETAPLAGRLARAWRRLRRWRYQETDTRRHDRDQGCLVQHGLYTVAGVDYAADYDDVGGLLRALNRPGVLPPATGAPASCCARWTPMATSCAGGASLRAATSFPATAASAAWRTSSKARTLCTAIRERRRVMRMRLSVRHDGNRAAGTAGGAAVDPVTEEEDARGAWGEGGTHLVYRGWLPRYTLTLDATPDALVYRRRDRGMTYPPCIYRWRDIVSTAPDEDLLGVPWFSLRLWLPADAVDQTPGVQPGRWDSARLPATRAVVDLVNRHTPHLPSIWLPAASAYGGYAQHDRSSVIAPDGGRDPRTRFARWFRPYRWDPR